MHCTIIVNTVSLKNEGKYDKITRVLNVCATRLSYGSVRTHAWSLPVARVIATSKRSYLFNRIRVVSSMDNVRAVFIFSERFVGRRYGSESRGTESWAINVIDHTSQKRNVLLSPLFPLRRETRFCIVLSPWNRTNGRRYPFASPSIDIFFFLLFRVLRPCVKHTPDLTAVFRP